MAVPVVESSSTYTDTTGSAAHSPTAPSGVVANDLLVAFLACRTSSVTITEPTGWTKIYDYQASNGWSHMCVAYKVATGTDSYEWTYNISGEASIVVARISGVDTTTPVDVYDNINDEDGNTDITTPSVTTTVDDTLILRGIGNRDHVVYGSMSGSHAVVAHATPGTGSTGDSQQQVWEGSQTTAGATGTASVTATAGDERGSGCFTMAIAPAAGGGPTTSPWYYYAQQS